MSRRTKDEMSAIREEIYRVCEEDQPMTVRQVFYRLVAAGVIPKTESQYRTTVIRLLGEMRESYDLPWSWIVDNTRWMRKPRSFSGVEEALRNTAQFYRRSLWTDDQYIEIWLEKDALAGVLYSATAAWDVPLMVTRGYPSSSFLYTAAEQIVMRGAEETTIYYFGDYDPTGVHIPISTEDKLRRYCDEIGGDASPEISFIRAGVNPDQIIDLDLQTAPISKKDTRSRGFVGGQVQLDAIPPRTLREMVEDLILQHVDAHELDVLRTAEESERGWLRSLADVGVGGAA